MESIASELSQNLQSESNPYQKVEEDDKDLPTVLVSHPLLGHGHELMRRKQSKSHSQITSSVTKARMIVHMQRGKRDMPRIGEGGQGRIWWVPFLFTFSFSLPITSLPALVPFPSRH